MFFLFFSAHWGNDVYIKAELSIQSPGWGLETAGPSMTVGWEYLDVLGVFFFDELNHQPSKLYNAKTNG